MQNEFSPKELIAVFAACILGGALANHIAALIVSKSTILRGLQFASDHAFDPSSGVLFSSNSYAMVAALLTATVIGYIYFRVKTKGNFRRGEEHGSSRWATIAEMKRFADQHVAIDNTILGQNVELAYSPAKRDHEHERQRNVLVVGGTGSGKTRGYVKPNLMQIPAEENAGTGKEKLTVEQQEKWARSYFVTDPKGTTRVETGHLFAAHGYKVLELNTIDFDVSSHYNPLKYVRNEEDVLSFATCLIKNTTPPDAAKSNDPFWEKCETLLYSALINYMMTEMPPEDRNLVTMFQLLDMAKVMPEGQLNGLDILMKELETGMDYVPDNEGTIVSAGTSLKRGGVQTGAGPWRKSRTREPQPYHPAVVNYNACVRSAGDTMRSIIISCHSRIGCMRPERVQAILKDDEMDLDMFGDRKMVCYAVVSASDPTYNFLLALLMWQMMNELMRRGTTVYGDKGGRLPVGVDFILDEAANFYVPNLEQTISTVRSYNIGITIILQSLNQLKARYHDDAETIIDNCPSLVFLGGKSKDTNKTLEETIGQETVSTDNQSRTHAQASSWQEQQAQHGRALAFASEIAKMSNSKELVLIQGANPWRGPKYDVEKHPMYKWIDPGHKGCHEFVRRGFSYEAYKENPRYYEEGDCELATDATASLMTALPLNVVPARERAFAVRENVVIENSSDGPAAYDLHGTFRYDVTCKSNVNGTVFSAVEPFGKAGGMRFSRVEIGSNRAPIAEGDDSKEVLAWYDTYGEYRLARVHLDPGERLVLRFSLAVPKKEVMRAFRQWEHDWKRAHPSAGADEATAMEDAEPDMHFGFRFTGQLKCANHDTIEVEDEHDLSIGPWGFPELTKVEKAAPAPEDEGQPETPQKKRPLFHAADKAAAL